MINNSNKMYEIEVTKFVHNMAKIFPNEISHCINDTEDYKEDEEESRRILNTIINCDFYEVKPNDLIIAQNVYLRTPDYIAILIFGKMFFGINKNIDKTNIRKTLIGKLFIQEGIDIENEITAKVMNWSDVDIDIDIMLSEENYIHFINSLKIIYETRLKMCIEGIRVTELSSECSEISMPIPDEDIRFEETNDDNMMAESQFNNVQWTYRESIEYL